MRQDCKVTAAALVAIGAMGVALPTAEVGAIDRTWDNGAGDFLWSNATNWSSNTLPGTGDTAIIDGASTVATPVLISAGSPVNPGKLIMGNALGTAGFLDIQDNISWGSGIATQVIGNAGAGTVTHSAGIFGTTGATARGLTLGEASTGVGTYTMSGTAQINSGIVDGVKIGNGGTGTMNQSAGSVYSEKEIWLGRLSTGSGTYSLSGTGRVGAKNSTFYVGDAGTGVFYQSGGTFGVDSSNAVITRAVILGNVVGGSGAYNLSGGDFKQSSTDGNLIIGNAGTGVFTATAGNIVGGLDIRIGNLAGSNGTLSLSGTATITRDSSRAINVGIAGTGTLNIAGNTISAGGSNASISVGASGLIQGYGTYSSGNSAGSVVMLTTNGRIIADGGGVDRTLAFIGGGAFSTTNQLTANTVENSTTNGWYAQDHGKLMLSKVSIGVNGAGGKSVTFAESAGDATIDLVNSARFNFNATNSINATADVSLLAADRTDLIAAPAGIAFIGVWNLALAGGAVDGFSAPSYQFRYDDLAAGLNVPTLYRLTGGTWTAIASSNDVVNHILSTSDSGITTFNNTFAIGVAAVPEPASLGLLGLAAAVPTLRRRRHG